MRRKYFLLLSLLLLSGISRSWSLSTAGLSEMLQNAFAKKNAFVLIERRKLDQIMKEQQLEMAGIIENQASRLGQMVGAEKIITGSLMKVDGKFVILVKMIDVASGRVDITEGVKVNDESKLEKGVNAIAGKIVKQAQAKWQASLRTMMVAMTEIEDMREENKPEYRQYIVKVTPTVQSMKESYRSSFIISVDILSLLSRGLFLDYEFAFNRFGVGMLLNFSIPAPGSFLFSFGMDMKYYPFKVARMLNPYLGLGYMMTFNPYTMPIMASGGIRIHPIPGWDRIFIDAGGGVMVDIMSPIMGGVMGTGSEWAFRPFITAKAGWKF